MSTSLLQDAFDHHVWATLRLFDACQELSPEQLAATAPGTYGSILNTMRHLVGADAAYLRRISGQRFPEIEEEAMDMAELRAAMDWIGPAWTTVLAEGPDPDRVIERQRDDGSATHAAIGIRLAQALHHGTDHRSQVCTVLTTVGMEPPEIDVWAFGATNGRVVEFPPTA